MTRIELPTSPQRILLIKPSALGDVVHALPVLNLLKQRWPAAKISWLIASSFAEIIRGHPQVDEVIAFDRDRFSRAWYDPFATAELFQFIQLLRSRRFDLVVDLQGLFRSGILAALTRAPFRVGFANAREMAHLFYTHHVPIESMEQHAVDRYLAVADALGCRREPVRFDLSVSDATEAEVDSMLHGVGRFALLLPGTNWPTKRWPAEHFAGLIAPLRQKHGLSTVLGGGPDAVPIAAEIRKVYYAANAESESREANLDLTGHTTLPQLVALIRRAELVIANDSGPMHIAAAMNKPLITPFGPTNPIRTGPYQRLDSVIRADIPCSPCYSKKCSHVSCMKLLEAEPVLIQIAAQSAAPQRRSIQ